MDIKGGAPFKVEFILSFVPYRGLLSLKWLTVPYRRKVPEKIFFIKYKNLKNDIINTKILETGEIPKFSQENDQVYPKESQ